MRFLKISQALLFLLTTLYAFGQVAQNEIDMLNTDSDVITFLKKNMTFKPDNITFAKLGGRPSIIMDSLKAQNWAKIDIDHNGKTDLVLLKLDGNLYLAAILDMNKYFTQPGPTYDTKYNLVYPVVKKSKNEYVFLIFNQVQLGYNSEKEVFEYSKLKCDTLEGVRELG